MQKLLADPALRQALESGKPGDVRSILERKLAQSSGEEQLAVQAALNDRRFFLNPANNSPVLLRFTGCGFAFSGRSDYDSSDDSYITTWVLTVLFIPLLPIRQYLARSAGEEGVFILGSVPMGPVAGWLRRISLAAMMTGAILLGATIWTLTTSSDVHLVNGLPVPVVVEFGVERVEVPPNGRRTLSKVEAGPYKITARTSDGRLIEELSVEVLGGFDAVAYNVLGAAPLYIEQVIYSEHDTQDPQATLLTGQSWFQRDHVEYVFKEAPTQITTSQYAKGSVIRYQLELLDGGWQSARGWLLSDGKIVEAARLSASVAVAMPGDFAAARTAINDVGAAHGLEETLPLLEKLLRDRPDDVQLHRHRQEIFLSLNRREETLEEYRRRHKENPTSADYAYLRARVELQVDGAALAEATLADHPEHPWLHRFLWWDRYTTRRFKEALDHLEAAVAGDPEQSEGLREYRLACLVGLGRAQEAFEELKQTADRQPDSIDFDFLLLYGRVARLAGLGEADLLTLQRTSWGSESPTPDDIAFLRARVRAGQLESGQADAVELGITKVAIELMNEAAMPGAETIKRVREVLSGDSATALQLVGFSTVLVLACEAARRDDRETAEELLEYVDTKPFLDARVLDGTHDSELLSLDLETQAVLALADARKLLKDDPRRESLLQQAAADDLLGGIVDRAVGLEFASDK